jgi:hypothetical protein
MGMDNEGILLCQRGVLTRRWSPKSLKVQNLKTNMEEKTMAKILYFPLIIDPKRDTYLGKYMQVWLHWPLMLYAMLGPRRNK